MDARPCGGVGADRGGVDDIEGGRWPDRPLTVAEARELGFSRGFINSKRHERPVRGVRNRAPWEAGFGLAARCHELLPRIPGGGYFCRQTAAQLWGMPSRSPAGESDPIHVALPAPHRAMDTRDAIGHQFQTRDEDVRTLDGLPVSSPARTWCDLAAVIDVRWLVAVGDFILRERDDGPPLASIEELRHAHESHVNPRGRRSRARALPLLDARSASPRESELRMIFHDAGLPAPALNPDIRDGSGRWLAKVDFAWPQWQLVIEYEGDYHRTDRAKWLDDIDRVRRLEAAGWQVARATIRDIVAPAALLHRIDLRRKQYQRA